MPHLYICAKIQPQAPAEAEYIRKEAYDMDKKGFISAIHRIMNMPLGNDKVSITGTNKLLVLITVADKLSLSRCK